MNAIAIITARGGSKRIPRKNIKEFCGRPIIEYSIKAALNSNIFEEVMVSTDDEQIAAVAKAAGANVPFFRSAKTAGDFATTADVLNEVFDRYKAQGREFDYACCLYPTAPFITANKLKAAMNMLICPDTDSVVPVVPFSFPPQRGFVINDDILSYQYPEYRNTRSQDLPTIYHDCGQFYCFKVDMFLQHNTAVYGNVRPFIVDETEVQDIDNLSDWHLAEIKYRFMLEQNK